MDPASEAALSPPTSAVSPGADTTSHAGQTFVPPLKPVLYCLTLVVLGGNPRPQLHLISSGEERIIGRLPPSTIQIPEEHVSTQHCKVVVDDDGSMRIELLPTAKNDVLVNGYSLRAAGGTTTLLEGIPVIVAGHSKFSMMRC